MSSICAGMNFPRKSQGEGISDDVDAENRFKAYGKSSKVIKRLFSNVSSPYYKPCNQILTFFSHVSMSITMLIMSITFLVNYIVEFGP